MSPHHMVSSFQKILKPLRPQLPLSGMGRSINFIFVPWLKNMPLQEGLALFRWTSSWTFFVSLLWNWGVNLHKNCFLDSFEIMSKSLQAKNANEEQVGAPWQGRHKVFKNTLPKLGLQDLLQGGGWMHLTTLTLATGSGHPWKCCSGFAILGACRGGIHIYLETGMRLSQAAIQC